jgi:hypothetical protein
MNRLGTFGPKIYCRSCSRQIQVTSCQQNQKDCLRTLTPDKSQKERPQADTQVRTGDLFITSEMRYHCAMPACTVEEQRFVYIIFKDGKNASSLQKVVNKFTYNTSHPPLARPCHYHTLCFKLHCHLGSATLLITLSCLRIGL